MTRVKIVKFLSQRNRISKRIIKALIEDLKKRSFIADLYSELPVPEIAYDPLRDQYDGEYFLDQLIKNFKNKIDDEDIVLGITAVDLWAWNLNFVFGLATVNGSYALISIARLYSKDSKLFQTRILKEAIHEIGHTRGLHHCNNRSCVMKLSNTLQDTDMKGSDYCKKCKARI